MPSISSDILIRLIVIAALALFFSATAFIRYATKIVPENKRVIIMRFGKIVGSRGPGIVTIFPIIDFAMWVDLEQTYHFKYDKLPTSDDQKISCAVTLQGKVSDPEKSVVNVPNLEAALSQVIETEMLDIARGKNSSELIQRRAWIEDQLKAVLYRSSRSWGFDVVEFRIDDIRQT